VLFIVTIRSWLKFDPLHTGTGTWYWAKVGSLHSTAVVYAKRDPDVLLGCLYVNHGIGTKFSTRTPLSLCVQLYRFMAVVRVLYEMNQNGY
jgi:hypothetical protein